jgi:aspartyl-tRNA(Asn)/glutamyl-tRNA(Gln) amidotransferase subunit A
MADPRRPSASKADELAYLGLGEVSRLLRSRQVSPIDLTEACLARIERLNPILNAFITVTADAARAQARQSEVRLRRRKGFGPLDGIPIALKDLIDTAGVRTTSACGAFKDRIPAQDATVVRKLKAAGAVILGKLNMHECAFGGSSVTSYFGPVRNPWDVAHLSGGSSGGSAAAVAAGLCYAALGSDTAGSIREPAAFCGIVGLVPTYGRVSTRGVMPLSRTLDHVGPMTRTVTDAAAVLQAIAGYDPGETTSVRRAVGSLTPGSARRLKLRVGVPRSFFYEELDPGVEQAIEAALTVLRQLGAELRDVPFEVCRDRTVARAEAYAFHAENIARAPELYKPDTLTKLRMGATIDAPAYIQARREIDALRRAASDVFSEFDVLVTPTSPVVAPKFADWPTKFEDVVAAETTLLRNTRPFNPLGIPSISVPCGMTGAGMPVGMQISGPPWAEVRVLTVAAAFERATDWQRMRPVLPVSAPRPARPRA